MEWKGGVLFTEADNNQLRPGDSVEIMIMRDETKGVHWNSIDWGEALFRLSNLDNDHHLGCMLILILLYQFLRVLKEELPIRVSYSWALLQ